MKIRPIFNCWILEYLPVKAIVLYPFIFFERSKFYCFTQDPYVLKHEMIHVAQIRKIGWLKFYLTYLWRRRIYENEAYENEWLPLTEKEELIYGQVED